MPATTAINDQAELGRKFERVQRLSEDNAPLLRERADVRDLMDGGPHGISRLVGRDVSQDKVDLPVANFIEIAARRLGQKVGRPPTIKVDPPIQRDNEGTRKKADKRARIVSAWDELSAVELVLPRVGRWLPGYGLAVVVMYEQTDPMTGDPFPHIEFRDPYNAFPGYFGWNQQPKDLAFAYKVPAVELKRKYPGLASKIDDAVGAGQAPNPLIGTDLGRPTSANQSGNGLDVYEYWDTEGTWWLCPALGDSGLLEFMPNILESGPAFRIVARPTFNKLGGIYNQAIGLVGAIARLNVLSVIAAEDIVNSETFVSGNMLNGKYVRGKRAINYGEPGSDVKKVNDRIPFEVFNQQERLLEQLRAQASYPKTDDAVSPNSFVTGRGLQELASSVDLEVKEFQTYLRHLLQGADAMRLEYMDRQYPERRMTIAGSNNGEPFSETYVPKTHIAGQYRTRRVYGIMAGWDEPNKIVTGLNMMQAGVLDDQSFVEQLDGMENPSLVLERVRNTRLEALLFQGLGAKLDQGDPNAMQAIVKLLPESDMKKLLDEVLVQPMLAAAQQQAQAPAPGGGPAPGGPPPDTMTVLNRLFNGQADMGVQTVGQVA